MILDNLRKAGVQNTVKNERLKFDMHYVLFSPDFILTSISPQRIMPLQLIKQLVNNHHAYKNS